MLFKMVPTADWPYIRGTSNFLFKKFGTAYKSTQEANILVFIFKLQF